MEPKTHKCSACGEYYPNREMAERCCPSCPCEHYWQAEAKVSCMTLAADNGGYCKYMKEPQGKE